MKLDVPSYLLGKKAGGGGEAKDMSEYFGEISGGVNATIGAVWTAGIKKMSDFTISGTDAGNLFRYYQGTTVDFSNTDTSAITNMGYMFRECSNLTDVVGLNTENVKNMDDMFENCSSMVNAPNIDTRNATSLEYWFSGCTNLTNVPVYDISSATKLTYMFLKCNNLSDESLDNILAMCVGATNYTGTKTLYELRITTSQYPASKIQGLSNYQAFIDAGWTIS